MLYLDYDRSHGEWLPNVYGENKNLEAIAFIKKLNTAIHEKHPDVLVIAEESTAWDGVTRSCADGGLGFDLKWNMGWANDFYKYVSKDPLYRRYHHSALNFPIMYAFNEKFLLPISHDEVVHGKGSFINKMHGSVEDKFAQMRASLLFMMTFPGKKMTFMGTEFAQFSEWDFDRSLEWFMLDFDTHFAMREYVAALNRFYLSRNELWELDFSESGFQWIYPDESDFNFVAYKRFDKNGNELICAVSFSGDDIRDIKIPVSCNSSYEAVFSTDASSDIKLDCFLAEDGSRALSFHLPRFGGVIFKKIS
jgi:1,4-alpha-glucan branching enzyme